MSDLELTESGAQLVPKPGRLDLCDMPHRQLQTPPTPLTKDPFMEFGQKTLWPKPRRDTEQFGRRRFELSGPYG